MRLQAAPFGAFLPWRDLTTLWVPPLASGASVMVDTEVQSPRPRPLGRFDRVPPERLLTALDMSDEDDRHQPSENQHELRQRSRLRRWLSRWQASTSSSLPALPPDPADLLGRPNQHWAGNINVLIGRTAVERHQAQALRIYPGCTNVAMMFVGEARRDRYLFDLKGSGVGWNARLTQLNGMINRRSCDKDKELKLKSWHRFSGPFPVCVSIEPPKSCDAGELEVHVTRKSTGETAIVEFSLDPKARGPGCYTM
jgi:hypothetical protein